MYLWYFFLVLRVISVVSINKGEEEITSYPTRTRNAIHALSEAIKTGEGNKTSIYLFKRDTYGNNKWVVKYLNRLIYSMSYSIRISLL